MSTPSLPIIDVDHPQKPVAGRPVVLIEDVYPHAFWLEKYNRLGRPTDTIFDQFNPHTMDRVPFALKPNSRADKQLLSCPKYRECDGQRYRHFKHMIDQRIVTNLSKDRNQHMMLTSYTYGSQPTFDRTDDNGRPIRECFRPVRRAMLSDFSEQLVRFRITERPKFTGKVRFNL